MLLHGEEKALIGKKKSGSEAYGVDYLSNLSKIRARRIIGGIKLKIVPIFVIESKQDSTGFPQIEL